MGKPKKGDGRALAPMRGWQVLHRTMFGIDHAGHRYVVDVPIFDDTALLYVDGKQRSTASLPARFPVPGGRIEVASSTYGLKRMHLVLDGESERQLYPAPLTAEWWRARLGSRHPRLSRWIARAAVLMLVLGLAVALPEAAERITAIDAVAERVGTFTSPVVLPGWLTVTVLVGGALAAIERALTLRNHWLLDLDTFWLS